MVFQASSPPPKYQYLIFVVPICNHFSYAVSWWPKGGFQMSFEAQHSLVRDLLRFKPFSFQVDYTKSLWIKWCSVVLTVSFGKNIPGRLSKVSIGGRYSHYLKWENRIVNKGRKKCNYLFKYLFKFKLSFRPQPLEYCSFKTGRARNGNTAAEEQSYRCDALLSYMHYIPLNMHTSEQTGQLGCNCHINNNNLFISSNGHI